MKIKKLLTESSLLMAIAIVATVGVASAAIVNYLTTGSVTTTTEVSSPIDMSINEGRDSTNSGNHSISMATTGGSDFTFTTVAKNNANNKIEGYRAIVIKAPYGQNFAGGEITNVELEWAGGTTDITDHLVVVYSDGSLHDLSSWTGDSRKLVLITKETDGSATKASLDAGESDWNAITVTTNPAIAPGPYKISSDFAVDLATFAAEQYSK
jgi:hypothetical protein